MPVPVKMADLFTIAASNSPAGSDPIGNSLDDYLRATQAIIRSTNALASASLAAGSTTDLGSADAESVQITGTATITSLGTVASGIVRECRFAAACTLVNSSSITLPGAANITTNAGDVLTFRSLGSGNWVLTESSAVYGYLPLAGGALTGALTVQTSGASNSITILDTGSGGANLKFIGNGATTPNKYIRTYSGNLEFVNSAYTTAVATISDGGAFTALGNISGSSLITSAGTVTSSASTLTLQPTGAGSLFLRPNNGSSSGQVTIASDGTFTTNGSNVMNGGLSVTTSGSLSSITITDTGVAGANLKLAGSGGTTPNKYIRANGGALQFVNHAYTTVISALSDGGVWTASDFQVTSDLRLKQGCRLLKRGMAELRRMRPIEYMKDGRPEIGFGAQHAEEVIPEAVSVGCDGFLRLSHVQIAALVANAVLELDERMAKAGI